MANKKIDRFLTGTSLLIVLGLACIIAGIYFTNNNLTSSGVKMGRYGTRGGGTLDGKGMVFCGIVIAGFGLVLKDWKTTNEDK